MTLFLDAAAPLGTVGLAAGAIFFVVLAAAAFIAAKMLKKTVKMAFRIAIVLIIIAIGIVGCVSFWAIGSDRPARPQPARPR